MATLLKVLTLNCWAQPFPTAGQQKSKRLEAIGKEIGRGDYDIVVLQEVWLVEDYEKLAKYMSSYMKYNHYFHSGVIGSGVCIFSKHPILETLQHRYSLNGYAHKLQHFDWYGAKMVGLCKILLNNEIRINVYATHLHAFYHHPYDEYKAHRTVQAFEMSQFIKHTSETCDIVVVAGDLNTRPEELGLAVLTSNANLDDAWTSQKVKPKDDTGATCDCPENSFRGTSLDKEFPKGYRLDYLLYRDNTGYKVDCEKCYVTMGKIPGEEIHYSDHEGVAAEFKIKRNITAIGKQRDLAAVERSLSDCLPAIDEGLTAVESSRYFYLAILALSLVALAYLSSIQASYSMYIFLVNVLYLGILCLIVFAGWNGIVMITLEKNTLMAAKKDINNLLCSNF